MNLNNFEHFISPTIFERGLDYYENDCIRSLTAKGNHSYEGEVEGSELYTVTIELDELKNIVEITCDCPYDMGPYCKHEAAALLALRDQYVEGSQGSKPFDLEEVLSLRSKEVLIDFLIELADEDDEIKKRMALHFDNATGDDDLRKAVSLIRSYINKNADRHGFVHYRDTMEATRGAELVIEKAKRVLEQGNWIHAFDLSLCVIREMIELIGNADDSDGSVGGVIYEGYHFIRELVQTSALSDSTKEVLFNKLLEEANHERYDDWTEWRLELLESCSMLAVLPTLRNQLESRLHALAEHDDKNGSGTGYFNEQVNLIRYGLILKHEGQTAALAFIKQHLHYSGFRKIAIENALHQQDYVQVIELALEGEAKDKHLRGLVNDWRKYRYRAYESLSRLEEQRALAIDFILQGEYDFYLELKRTYESMEWPSIYPKILEQYDNDRYFSQETYTRILIEESEWQKLLAYVQDRPSTLERYYQHLLPMYKEEVYTLFVRYIEQNAAAASNRKDYRQVCAIIRKLKKAGGAEEAADIKEKLYLKYANRPAFRDELTKIR